MKKAQIFLAMIICISEATFSQNHLSNEDFLKELNDGDYYFLIDGIKKEVVSFISVDDASLADYKNFEILSPFNNELALFKYGDAKENDYKYGFIDKSFNIAIKPKFKKARPFRFGYAAVYNRDKMGNYSWNFIDEKGNLVSQTGYSDVLDFESNYAIVQDLESNKMGVIDNKGNVVIPLKYSELSSIGEGFVSFQDSKSGNFGYIDMNNKIVIPAKFEFCGDFSDGLAFVVLSDPEKFGFIDKTGKMIISLNHKNYAKESGWIKNYYRKIIGRFHDGLCVMYDPIENKWGYINKKGEWVIEPKYADAFNFNNGIARILKERSYDPIQGTKWIDSDDTFLSESDPRLINVFQFSRDDGYCIVNGKNEKITSIGKKLIGLIQGQFDDIGNLQSPFLILASKEDF